MSTTARPGGKLITQWRCLQCKKYLSSKRSYREHMNIHNQAKPFQCDDCPIAFASQMTLRRHRLRMHIPKSEWGYSCPYCPEKYMEPASYEQHVSRHHFGLSCTYGCPHHSCNFVSKSSKYFLEHISRHHMVIVSSQSNTPLFPDNMAPDSIKACYYLIDDEIGSGYGKPPKEAEIHRYDDVLSLTNSKSRSTSKPKQTESTSRRIIPKVIPIAPKTSVPQIQPIEEVEAKEMEYTTLADELINSNTGDEEEVIYEEVEEDEEEVTQYYELVDENGISIDNQYYEIDPTTEYAETEEFMEEDMVEVPNGQYSNATNLNSIPKDAPRLPDGQVEFELD